MKYNDTPTPVDRSAVLKEMDFGISASGMPFVLDILRNRLYSDKPQAVVREYLSNAWEASALAGNGDKPIEVFLPNRFDGNFRVRDFGNGLSPEQMDKIFTKYGESTKRDSNEFSGMFGIGAKAGFAYGDNFMVTTWNNGVKTVYNAYIDETKVGKLAVLKSVKSSEPSGLEIQIPVRPDDMETFKDKVVELCQYWKVKPVVTGQDVTWPNRKFVVQTDKWALYNYGEGDSVAVMGNIAYPIDVSSINFKDSEQAEREIINQGVELIFGIGDINIAANREALEYTEKTQKAIVRAASLIKKNMEAEAQKAIAAAPDILSAKMIYKQLPRFVRDDFKGKWKTHDIEHGYINWEPKVNKSSVINGQDISTVHYTHYFWRRGRRWGSRGKPGCHLSSRQLDCDPKQIFWVDDKPSNNIKRINAYIEAEHNKGNDIDIYVFDFGGNDALRKEWEKETGVDTSAFKLVSSIPEPPKAPRAPRDPNGDYKTPSHYAIWKDFESHRSTNKGYWEIESGNCPKSGVYLEIKHYNIVNTINIGTRGACFADMSSLIGATRQLSKLIKMPDAVYGFTPRQVKNLGVGWQKFDDYINEEIQKVATSVKLTRINWGDYRESTYNFLHRMVSDGHLPDCNLSTNIKGFLVEYQKCQYRHPLAGISQWHEVEITEINFNDFVADLDSLPLVKHFAAKDYYTTDKEVLAELGSYASLKLQVGVKNQQIAPQNP